MNLSSTSRRTDLGPLTFLTTFVDTTERRLHSLHGREKGAK